MPHWLSTPEAASRLGVKPATLYAYVSRGVLASTRVPGHRGSAFDAGDVERLLAARTRAGRRPPGRVEATSTALSSLAGDTLHYRGRSAVDLAAACPQRCSFEAVAELLWTGELADAPVAWPAPAPADATAVRAVVAALGPDAPLPRRLRVAVAALPVRGAAASLSLLVAALDGASAPPPVPASGRLAAALTAALLPPVVSTAAEAAERVAQDVEVAMVLLADHGLAVSTLAARVAASARAEPPDVLAAALGAAAGPVHAGASSAAGEVLDRVVRGGADAAAAAWRAGTPPGFGHVLYAASDPRAEHLLHRLPPGPVADAVDALCAAAPLRADAFPNVDLALAALAAVHRLRPGAGQVLFEVARTAGWLAHAAEERAAPALRYRAAGRYDGVLPGAVRDPR